MARSGGSEAEQIIPAPQQLPEKKPTWVPEVIPGGKQEKKETKPAVAGGGRGKSKWLKIGAGIGVPVVLGSGGAAAYFIQQEQNQSENQITENEQGETTVTITTETTPPTTQETIPPTTVTETTAPETTAEVEKTNAPEIKGAIFNQETKSYTAEANNPWGFKEGEVIGIYVSKAFTLERLGEEEKVEDAIGFVTKVIKTLQEESLREKNDYFFPLIVDFQKTKGVEVMGLKYGDDKERSLGFIIPKGTELYSPFAGNFEAFSIEINPEYSISYTFDINEKDRFGGISIFFNKENMLLDLKKSGEQEIQVTDESGEKVSTTLTIFSGQAIYGELMASFINDSPLLNSERSQEILGEEVQCQFFYNIMGKDNNIFGWDRILEKDGKKIFILSDIEETAREPKS